MNKQDVILALSLSKKACMRANVKPSKGLLIHLMVTYWGIDKLSLEWLRIDEKGYSQ